jgi:hypothetical protein
VPPLQQPGEKAAPTGSLLELTRLEQLAGHSFRIVPAPDASIKGLTSLRNSLYNGMALAHRLPQLGEGALGWGAHSILTPASRDPVAHCTVPSKKLTATGNLQTPQLSRAETLRDLESAETTLQVQTWSLQKFWKKGKTNKPWTSQVQRQVQRQVENCNTQKPHTHVQTWNTQKPETELPPQNI